MAKRKATVNSSEDLAPLATPQTRLLRSKKRKYPSDDISPSDDVQTLHQQEHDGKITPVLLSTVAVVVTPLQSLQLSPLQKCAMIKDQQDEAAQQPCVTEQRSSTSEKQTEATNEATNEAENIHLTVTEEEKATVSDDSQLANKHTDEKSKEEIAAGECKRSLDKTSTDQLHVPEDADGSSASALKNLEINQKNSQEDSSMISIVDVRQNTKESAAGLPAKKKQRMGVCGLTEKERRQILLIQNVEKRMKRGEICSDTTEPVIMSPSPSIPANSHKEQSEAEPKLQSIHCGENDRKQNEVHATVTTSEGTRTACDPEEKGCEGKGVIAPGPDQTDNPESDMPAEKAEEGGLENQMLELKGPAAEIVDEKPEKERERVEVESGEINCESAITVHTSQKEEAKEDAPEAAELQMITLTRTRDEKEEETGDAVGGDRAGECTSSAEQLRGLRCESKEVCEPTVTPNTSEKKRSCETDVEPAADSSTVSTEGVQTRDKPDPFGSECIDYVSDSQLNTIVLIEEVVTEKEKKNESSNCHEDASDLIHGLIRELSSLNRRVMAAHRELENLRRSSKGSRSSTR